MGLVDGAVLKGLRVDATGLIEGVALTGLIERVELTEMGLAVLPVKPLVLPLLPANPLAPLLLPRQ